MDLDDMADVHQEVFTGALPGWADVQLSVDEAHGEYRWHEDGVVADYIPVLAEADPDWFGVAVAQTNGRVHGSGDCDVEFTIQSISKAFVFALVCDAIGHDMSRRRWG